MNTVDSIFDAAHARGIKQVRMIIYQPKVYNGPREATITLAQLREFADHARGKAQTAQGSIIMAEQMPRPQWERIYLNPTPNEQECAFCKALPTCPAARRAIEESVGSAFSAVEEQQAEAAIKAGVSQAADDDLGLKMKSVGFVEDWCKAVRAETERRLLAGTEVAGFGLELGRQGPRKWTDDEQAEQMLRKQFRLSIEDAYNLKLKSPTQVELLAKPKKGAEASLGPRQWEKLQALIGRADPKPSVKPAEVIKTPWKPEAIRDAAFTPVVDDDLS
jgi:hypothetical protein